MQWLFPFKLAEMVHKALVSNRIWIVGGAVLTPLRGSLSFEFLISMPTQFLAPQTSPTVVTCLPINALLVRFTYEINLRIHYLIHTYFCCWKSRLPWLRDQYKPKQSDQSLHHEPCLQACLAQALQQGLLYRAERLSNRQVGVVKESRATQLKRCY